MLPTRLKVVTQVLEGLGASGEAIMRNKHNKLQLSKVLSTYNFGERVTVESQSDGVFSHEDSGGRHNNDLIPSYSCRV